MQTTRPATGVVLSVYPRRPPATAEFVIELSPLERWNRVAAALGVSPEIPGSGLHWTRADCNARLFPASQKAIDEQAMIISADPRFYAGDDEERQFTRDLLAVENLIVTCIGPETESWFITVEATF